MKRSYGTCVTVRPREDGTSKFRFEVRRNRPPGWKRTIPILVDGRDSVLLDAMTPAQEAAVERRADDLYRQLEAMRAAQLMPIPADPVPANRSWERLMELRRAHSKWLERKPATKTTYLSTQRKILKIFGRDPALAPSEVLESQIDALVRAHVRSSYRRKALYIEIRILLRKAIREGWRDLAKDLVYSTTLPTPRIRLWAPAEFRCAVTAAIQTGERGLARLMVCQWEIGQRLQSVRNFRYGVHYKDGVFIYRCVKGGDIRIEILNVQARRALDEGYREGAWMFPKSDTGKPFTGPELSRAFTRIRKSVPGFDQKLQLRELRHTVICELALADCNVLEIATVTSHGVNTVHRTIQHYFKENTDLARRAMEKRERRRLENVAGLSGELIIAGTRRIFIGDLLDAPVPVPLQETKSHAA